MKKSEIIQKDYLIDSLDPEVKIEVREKRLKGKHNFTEENTVLLCHGRLAPGPVAFDLSVPGYSWMDYIADRGFNVFTMSVRGFGRSSRPCEMDKDPIGKRPLVRGKTAMRDIEAVVRFICERNGIDRINLLGRSWSTTTTAAFTAANPSRVNRLVLYAPYYAYNNPERAARFEDPNKPGRWNLKNGSWIWTTEKDLHERWWGHISGSAHRRWRDMRLVRAYWKEFLATDPEGAKKTPPVVRTPNGSLADLYDRVRNKPPYNASKIRCPVLLIYGEQDGAANPTEAWNLFQKLTASHGKRYVVMGEGTHFMEFEHRREEFLAQVQGFLET
jgi:pimeloyl-ACP methyl ester carboxylesterase